VNRLFAAICIGALVAWSTPTAQDVALPNVADSVKFAVIGDSGTGKRPQYDVAEQMINFHGKIPFDTVIMLGDNVYGGHEPADFVAKFERPYKPLLDAGVRFYASLGNHDRESSRAYEPWNMGGRPYYTWAKQNVRFFALDSNHMDPPQVTWLQEQLEGSHEAWRIAYFHHPLYSSAARHGSELKLRAVLEPLFVKHGVNVVFSGHDHVYQRIKPQHGVHYFVAGAAGQLRRGNVRKSELTEAAFDQDRSFVLVEVAGDELTSQAVSRTGETVDFGTITRERIAASVRARGVTRRY
jgi:predicted phosphodiesterase